MVFACTGAKLQFRRDGRAQEPNSKLRVRLRHPTNYEAGGISYGTHEMGASSTARGQLYLTVAMTAFPLADNLRFSAQDRTERRSTTYDNADPAQGSFWQFLGLKIVDTTHPELRQHLDTQAIVVIKSGKSSHIYA